MNHPSTLSRSKTGLLVIDVQEKFAPVIAGFDDMVENVVRLVLAFRMFDLPILVTEQYPKGLGHTVGPVRKELQPYEPVEKMAFSCVQDAGFMKRLGKMGADTLVVCGIESHVCVNQTVLGLMEKGKKVHVVADAISTRRGLDHRMAWEKMLRAGAMPATTEMVLFELCGSADAEEFRKIQVLVKGRLKRPGAGGMSESTLRSTSLFSAGEGREAGSGAAAAPAARDQEAVPDIGSTESDVIATVEPAPGAAETPAEKQPAAPAAGKAEKGPAATAEDVEVLDIETLVDLRDTAGDHESEGGKGKK